MFKRSLSFLVLASLVACTPESKGAVPSTTPTSLSSVAATYAAPELMKRVGRASASGSSESKWTHPDFDMSFAYPDELLQVSPKPDGATLRSEILGKIEDRSGLGEDEPQPLTISISVRHGKLAAVLKSENVERQDCASAKVGGRDGCTFHSGSHDAQRDHFFAELPNGKTLQVECDYLGDMGRPKVSIEEQAAACNTVVRTLAYAP